jgi:hypothetical protein
MKKPSEMPFEEPKFIGRRGLGVIFGILCLASWAGACGLVVANAYSLGVIFGAMALAVLPLAVFYFFFDRIDRR